MNIHIVRIDGVNHAVSSTRSNPKRACHTMCGIRLADVEWQHRPGGYPHATIECDTDIQNVNALADLL